MARNEFHFHVHHLIKNNVAKIIQALHGIRGRETKVDRMERVQHLNIKYVNF